MDIGKRKKFGEDLKRRKKIGPKSPGREDTIESPRPSPKLKKVKPKPGMPVGGKLKAPKPGTWQYVQEHYLLKPEYKKRKGMKIGGRANLLEEMGRIDARKHPDAADRAEKKRVIGELNRGYKKGGLIKGKPKLAKRGWK